MEGESTEAAFGNSGSGTILLTDRRVVYAITLWIFSGDRQTNLTAEMHMNHSYYSMAGPSTVVGA
jgi:hypothetical protein